MKQKSLVIVTLFWVLSSCVKTEVEVDGSLFGSVKDGVSNAPIANCLVSIDSLHLSARTNAEGIYEFERLDMGRYQLRFKATNYQELSDSVVVAFGKKTQKDVLLNKVGVPGVLSAPASEITYNSARINANIIQDGGADINSCGFYWGTSTSDMKRVSSSVGSTFFYNLVSLQENTEYFYKAFAVNSFGEGVGNIVSFHTNSSNRPVVETLLATDVTGVSAVLHAQIISTPKEGVNSFGFYFGKDSLNLDKTVVVANSGGTSFHYDLVNLDDNVEYYFRAFMKTSVGDAVGSISSFKTLEVTLPQVLSNKATNITETSAIFNGELSSLGNDPNTEYGFVYGLSETNMPNKIKVGNGLVTLYSHTTTGLNKSTTYYFKSYASNKKGTSYGNVVMVKTPDFNGHDFVDLGLPSGKKWAKMNIGATGAKDFGTYYAWSENDIAQQSWGGTWTMPTLDDLNELVSNCTKKHINYTEDGVTTHWSEWTGPNGNVIILPDGGIYHVVDGYSYWENKNSGYYWSATLSPNSSKKAYLLETNTNSTKTPVYGITYKANIRPITKY